LPYLESELKPIKTHINLFSAEYKTADSQLRIYINLSPSAKVLSLVPGCYEKLAAVNAVTVDAENVSLGTFSGVWLRKTAR
jgi:hypothetical protein